MTSNQLGQIVLANWASRGQLLLNVRIVDFSGGHVTLKASAIQSIGKSLLLPIDCTIGWTYRPCRQVRQRFFNKLSNMIVIFIGKSKRMIQEGEYAKER